MQKKTIIKQVIIYCMVILMINFILFHNQILCYVEPIFNHTINPCTGTDNELMVFIETNNLRQSLDRRELSYDEDLTKIAYQRTYDMIENNYVSHYYRSDTVSEFELVAKEQGLKYFALGENIASTTHYADGFVMYNLWYSSPGHYANMTSEQYTRIGIAIVHFDLQPGEKMPDGNIVTDYTPCTIGVEIFAK